VLHQADEGGGGGEDGKNEGFQDEGGGEKKKVERLFPLLTFRSPCGAVEEKRKIKQREPRG